MNFVGENGHNLISKVAFKLTISYGEKKKMILFNKKKRMSELMALTEILFDIKQRNIILCEKKTGAELYHLKW